MGIDVLISICVAVGMVLTIILIGNTRSRPRVGVRVERQADPETL